MACRWPRVLPAPGHRPAGLQAAGRAVSRLPDCSVPPPGHQEALDAAVLPWVVTHFSQFCWLCLTRIISGLSELVPSFSPGSLRAWSGAADIRDTVGVCSNQPRPPTHTMHLNVRHEMSASEIQQWVERIIHPESSRNRRDLGLLTLNLDPSLMSSKVQSRRGNLNSRSMLGTPIRSLQSWSQHQVET